MRKTNFISTTFNLIQKIPLSLKTENVSKISGVFYGELLSIMKQKETIISITEYLPYLDGKCIAKMINIENDLIEELNMMILIWDQNKEKLPTIQKMIKNLYSYTIETEILQRLLEFLSKDTNNYERIFKELKLDNLLENIKAKIGDRKLKALTISVNYLQNVTLKITQTKIGDRELNAELHTIVEAPGLWHSHWLNQATSKFRVCHHPPQVGKRENTILLYIYKNIIKKEKDYGKLKYSSKSSITIR